MAKPVTAMVLCAAAVSALGLAGCGGSSEPTSLITQAPCPGIVILADGADLTRFSPGSGFDLTRMVVDARIAGFEARCDFTSRERRALEVLVTPRFEAERGPAAQGRNQDLGWFIAVTDSADTRVLDRQASTVRVNFPPNVSRAQAVTEPVRLVLPIANGMRAEDYIVRLSFQLTPEELALNRRRGPR
jgi:hypothetical protein